MSTDLPRRQQELYDLLVGKGDVPILELYEKLQGPAEHAGDVRYAQQWLGPNISRMNRRLAARKLQVKPGRMKSTYALIVTG